MRTNGAATRRFGAAALALTLTAAGAALFSDPAGAAIIPTVPLGTAANYSVLADQTVTNSGPSVLNKGLGLFPGTSVTGFPPGTILGQRNVANGPADIAEQNLTTAYNNAAGRTPDDTLATDLVGLTLVGGAYNTTANGPMALTGELTLDGDGDPSSVWIFQTGSSLTFGGSALVTLIDGASACNVFWQVGSSATLISGAAIAGNVMAMQSISAGTGATIQGRLLAREASVTLLTNVFTTPTCAGETTPPVTTPPTTPPTTAPGGGGPGTTPDAGTPGSGTPSTGTPGTDTGIDTGLGEGPGTPVSGPPRTGGAPLQSGGGFPWLPVLFVGLAVVAGTTDLVLTRRHRADELARVGATDPLKSS